MLKQKQTSTDANAKTAIKLPSDSIRYPKSHALYWKEEGRLFTQRGSLDYCCRFSHNGRRGFFDLNTPNKVEAQKRAAERYKFVVAQGWEAAEKNPEFRMQSPEPKVEILTVGSWINKVRAIARVEALTLLSYEQALRRIAAEAVLGLEHSAKTHAKWALKVDAIPLDRLSHDLIAKWIKTRLTKAGTDPRVQEKAKHTINHILRSAKALFSKKKVLQRLATETISKLPFPIPLVEVSLLEEDSSASFTPSVDPEKLLLLAQKELGSEQFDGESDAEFHLREQQWIALLLSFCGGLRRKESDLLEWHQVHLHHPSGPRIGLAMTKHFKAKNKAHAKSIPLDAEVAEILKKYYHNYPDTEFVLQSDRDVSPKGIGKPRCHQTWQALMKWLRAKGVDDIKPIHSLRKSIGSLMAKKHGIHAAQRHLRHTTPAITSKYYSNSEAVEVPGLGALLTTNPAPSTNDTDD